MKKIFGILLVGLLSISLEAHNRNMSKKITRPVTMEENISTDNKSHNLSEKGTPEVLIKPEAKIINCTESNCEIKIDTQ
jgi:hypothetical protein